MESLTRFLEKSQVLLNSSKEEYRFNFGELSQHNTPSKIWGGRESLHGTDYRLLLYSWFVESVCDIEKISENTNKARVWSWVNEGLANIVPDKPDQKLVNLLTEEIYNQFSINAKRARGGWPIDLKKELIAKEVKPKCWICKREFCDEAIFNFTTRGKKQELNPFPIVDFMFPRGVNSQDLRIEIEHVIPFSKKASDPHCIANLALSCGWCNNAKSNHMSIYTTSRNGKYFNHPALGPRSIPNRYWVVKLLMLTNECEVCKRRPNIKGNELRFSLKNPKGVANINNLKVVCGKCDDIKGDRLVEATSYKDKIFSKRSNFI
ncbi:HNH endonuclease [Pseudoalteromonas sp. Isolate6]|uniref:HNH endonuclease n=1 Tax=Pseudoalteromonas sp. Isolate6 TaxID=2908527 RepID=UPI001EFDDD91|nr:HNH endonuclease [Pseudoalteromonas sp. Isolate6]MCG9759937.1 HNH endonuclease [Pseudoalteromonas sp. Isolate6]